MPRFTDVWLDAGVDIGMPSGLSDGWITDNLPWWVWDKDWWWGDGNYSQLIDRRDIPSPATIPVGVPSVAVAPSGAGVPQLVPEPPPYVPPPSIVPSAPIGGNAVQVGQMISWNDFMQGGGILPADWNQYPMASQHPSVGTQTIVASDEGEGMGWFEDIYDVVDTAVGGVLPGGVPLGGTTPAVAYAPPQTTVQTVQATTTGGAVGTSPGPDYVYKHTCEKGWHWVKKRRRRRKRLATASDIKDIAALKGAFGVTGSQKAGFETYIATHS